MDRWTFLNDEFLPEEKAVLHFRDLAIQRGYGVFDFFKVINGIPVFLEEHLDRFYFSAGQMRLKLEHTRQELKIIISELLHRNGIAHTGVRITLTGGYSEDGYQPAKPNLLISLHSFTPPSEEQFDRGVQLVTYPHQRQLPHVKTIDYLMAIWLQDFVKQHGADDVLYHQNGRVTECPRSNFFIVSANNTLVTPRDHVLKGIIRMKLIETAKGFYQVEERDLHIDEIETAKEAFITSTTKTILPVRQIDGHIFPRDNAVTRQLYQSMLQLTKKELLPTAE